jgi:putative lipoic acid-binding regulatory protein
MSESPDPPDADDLPVPDPAGTTPEPPSALVFPTDFPIKIMGHNRLEFEPQIVTIVRSHAPDLDDNTVEVRQSRGGNYLALTVTIRAQSRAQLDALYRELTSHPLVKVVL